MVLNREQLERIRRENLNKFDSAYRSNLNRIEYNPSESIEHFMAKTICFILLRNGVPANQLRSWIKNDPLTYNFQQDWKDWESLTPDLITQWIKDDGQKFKHEWQRPQVVTEARFMTWYGKLEGKLKQRRADIFILDTGEIIEIETGKSYEKKDDVIVVRV